MNKTNCVTSLASIAIALGCILGISCTGDNLLDNRDFTVQEDFLFDVHITTQSLFQLEGVSGTIVVTGESGANAIRITGTKRVTSTSLADAEKRLQGLEVDIQTLDSKVRVMTVQPEDTEGRNYVVDYTITIPRNLELSVVNVSGAIDISSLESVVRATNVGGDVYPFTGSRAALS
jgi:hypothetical protein